MTALPALLDAALGYAAAGWPVFPCDPKTKKPFVSGDRDAAGKEIPNTGGVKKASCNAAVVRAWWMRWPKAMIGLATGAAAGVFVVDADSGADPDKGWPAVPSGELLDALARHAGVERLPLTWSVTTPRGGVHLYFAWPDGAEVGNRAGIVPRVDIRGEGGYVILPPSRRHDGNSYQWGVRLEERASAAVAPADLVDAIARRGRFAPMPETPAKLPPRGPVPAAAAGSIDAAVSHYVAAAVDRELAALAAAPKGTRNDAINRAAFALGQFVGACALAPEAARTLLWGVVDQWPNVAKSRRSVESGLVSGQAEPRDLGEVKDAAADRAARRAAEPPPPDPAQYGIGESISSRLGAVAPDRAPAAQAGVATAVPVRKPLSRRARKAAELRASDDELNAQLAFYPRTDLGNSERFVERNRGKLIFCEAFGWLFWDGRRWSRDGAKGRVAMAEHETVRAIMAEAQWLADHKERDVEVVPATDKKPAVMLSDALRGWARTSEMNARLAKLSDHAEAYLRVAPDRLDADPFKVNVWNGTIIIRREPGDDDPIEIADHDPGDYITKLAPVSYDANATCPDYDSCLAMVQPSENMRRFLHQWGGYNLTGDTSEQLLTFHWGKGKNGKSTILNGWGYVTGDYGQSIAIESFLDQGRARSGSAPTPDLARLPGVRYLRCSEPEKGAKLAEALIKLATGGEPMMVRQLNLPFFEFTPIFKLTMSGNYKPTIRGTDEGIWRRVRLVPWLVMVPVDKRVKDFDKLRLKPEASGILNRLLDGLRDWLDHGLIEPDEVIEATAEYRRDSDPLGRFLDAATEPSQADRVQATLLHAVFSAWTVANGERAWTPQGFGRAMRERGFASKHSDVNWWLGLKLIKNAGDFVDHEGKPRDGAGAGRRDDALEDDEIPS